MYTHTPHSMAYYIYKAALCSQAIEYLNCKYFTGISCACGVVGTSPGY